MVITFERALAKLEGLYIRREQAAVELETVVAEWRAGRANTHDVDEADSAYSTLRDRVAKGRAYMAAQWPERWSAMQGV